MGAYTTLWQVVALLLLYASCCLAQCDEDHFWDSEAARCTPCTKCSGPGREVTLRPCEGHRDTLCGSLQDLRIDWSSFSHAHHSGLRLPKGWQEELSAHSTHSDKLVFDDDFILPDDAGSAKPKKPKKGKNRSRKLQRLHGIEDDDDYADDVGSGAGDLEDEHLLQSLPRARSSSTTSSITPTPPPSLVEDLVVPEDAGVEPYADGDGDVSMRAAFTPVERLVWDWQAGVLVAAVCACVLFFVVAAVYAYQHVWHFRVLRKRLNADVEEISARLGLMSGMGHEHFQEPTTPPLGHHMQTRCQQMNEYSVPRKSKV